MAAAEATDRKKRRRVGIRRWGTKSPPRDPVLRCSHREASGPAVKKYSSDAPHQAVWTQIKGQGLSVEKRHRKGNYRMKVTTSIG